MKGIIYTRVSSEDQVEGTSLDFQEEICRKYCTEKGIEVVDVFREEGASAKSTDRAEFLRAIEVCRKSKGTIGAFVVAKVDRFARNTEDHFFIKKRLLDYGASLHSVTEPIGGTPIGKLIETVLAGTADFDNAIRKQRCSDGLSSRVKAGIWPWKAPVGYVCAQNKKHGLKKTTPDEPDPVIFPIIQKGLQEMALGLHSKSTFSKRLDALGLAKARGKQTRLQFAETILEYDRLKFYAGWIYNPFEDSDERYRKGLHKPMISDIDVHKIQRVLNGKARGAVVRNRHNPIFPLRRTARCDGCGKTFTGSSPRGNGGTYSYYHCYNKLCSSYGKNIAKDILEAAFTKYLSDVTPNAEWLAHFRASVIDVWKEKGRAYQADVNIYRRKLELLTEKRNRIFEMREDGSYSRDDFQERKAEIENELIATKISLSEARIEQLDIEAAVTYATNFIADLGRQWMDLPYQLRPRFQQLVFPDGIYYNLKSGFRTTKLGCIYELNRMNDADKYSLVHQIGFSWNQLLVELKEWLSLDAAMKALNTIT